MNKFPKRKPSRLKQYDYSQSGYYYITICVNDRMKSFGNITESKMLLNETGEIVRKCWENIAVNFNNVELDEYCIMPNHIHGIIIIRRGLIYQTRNKLNTGNNIDDYNQNELIPGMINHAPTDWMLMKNSKTTLGKIVRYFKARAAKLNQ